MNTFMTIVTALNIFIFYPLILWNTIHFAKKKESVGLITIDKWAYYTGICALLIGGIA